MKIRCINNKGTKLIKNQIYEVKYICGEKVEEYGYSCIILIDNTHYKNIARFSNLDGSNLDSVYYDEYTPIKPLMVNHIGLSELIGSTVCYRDGNQSKYFIGNNYYKVVDAKPRNNVYQYSEYLIKIESYESLGFISGFRFRLLTAEENRNHNIDILENKNIDYDISNRKFDFLTNDEKIDIIIKLLVKAKKEFTKNKINNKSIYDYIIEKDSIYGIEMKDIEEIKKLKIEDIFP